MKAAVKPADVVREALAAVQACYGKLQPVPGDESVGGARSALAHAMNALEAQLAAQASRDAL